MPPLESEQLTLFDPESFDDTWRKTTGPSSFLQIKEQLVVEKEYDKEGNCTKETRTIYTMLARPPSPYHWSEVAVPRRTTPDQARLNRLKAEWQAQGQMDWATTSTTPTTTRATKVGPEPPKWLMEVNQF